MHTRLTTSDPSAPLSALRVLIAEDDDGVRASLAATVAAFGHTLVAEANTAHAAVELALRRETDAMVLDVNLPDLAGMVAARQLAEALPDVALVFISDDPSAELAGHELAATPATALLPHHTPPRLLESTLRLAVSRTRELSAVRRAAHDAREQLRQRKLLEQAKGILMRRTRLSADEADALLVRSAAERAMPLAEVATAVVSSEPGYSPRRS